MDKSTFRQIDRRLDDYERRIRVLESGRVVKIKTVHGQDKSQNSEELILAIVNKADDCDESDEIQGKVLDQKSMEGKILLCFYISHKYFNNSWLTTGNVEKITSGLGSKIDIGNISNKIRGELRKYLESGAVRKKGQPTPYRLNRKGMKRFEEIIYGKNK